MSRLSKIVRIASPLVGLALIFGVCLPWFHLPILGYEVPAPAWNLTGLMVAIAGSLLVLRAILGPFTRWLIRIALAPAIYFWWGSLQDIKVWGSHTLAPTQLKIASLNSTLAKMGAETVTIYDPLAWKTLEPTQGWYFCGVALAAAVCLTALDGPWFNRCSQCQTKSREGDSFCFQCGNALVSDRVCANCGSKASSEDQFCRSCGGSFGEKGA